MMKIRWTRVLVALVAAFTVAGCATTSPVTTPEEQVMSRAQARWDLLLAGKMEAAYGYLSPAQRSAVTLLDYQRKLLSSKVRWKSADVEQAVCEEQLCTVSARLGIEVYGAVPGVSRYELKRNVEEKWIRSENEWWYVP